MVARRRLRGSGRARGKAAADVAELKEQQGDLQGQLQAAESTAERATKKAGALRGKGGKLFALRESPPAPPEAASALVVGSCQSVLSA